MKFLIVADTCAHLIPLGTEVETLPDTQWPFHSAYVTRPSDGTRRAVRSEDVLRIQ